MKKYRYVLGGILLLGMIATAIQPSFLSVNNMINVLRQASVLFLLSLGLTGVVLTGNIDLSVGSVAALTGCVCAKLMVSGHPIALFVPVSSSTMNANLLLMEVSSSFVLFCSSNM